MLERLVLHIRPLLHYGIDVRWGLGLGAPGSLTTDPRSSWRPLRIRNGIRWPSTLHKLTAIHPSKVYITFISNYWVIFSKHALKWRCSVAGFWCKATWAFFICLTVGCVYAWWKWNIKCRIDAWMYCLLVQCIFHSCQHGGGLFWLKNQYITSGSGTCAI